MNELLTELRKPFHPSQIEWKPQAPNKEGTKMMMAAYADIRAYQNRLDELCGLDWAVSYLPWGDKIICHLTILGVTRSSSGEPSKQSEKSEIGGTAAEAQAFKRACAMFGLGRYLYGLASPWVEWDKEHRKPTVKAQAQLDALVRTHYQAAMEGTASKMVDQGEQAPDPPAPVAAPPVASKPSPVANGIQGVPASPHPGALPPAVRQAERERAKEIIAGSHLNTPTAAQKWAADLHYRTDIHSAAQVWRAMIKDVYGGAVLTPALIGGAIETYVIQCLEDGQKSPS